MENKNHGIQSRVGETEKTARNKPIVNLVKMQKVHKVRGFFVCTIYTESLKCLSMIVWDEMAGTLSLYSFIRIYSL